MEDRTDRAGAWGTFVVNMSGSLLLGFLGGLVLYHGLPTEPRVVFGIGILRRLHHVLRVRLQDRRAAGGRGDGDSRPQRLRHARGRLAAAAAGLGLAAAI